MKSLFNFLFILLALSCNSEVEEKSYPASDTEANNSINLPPVSSYFPEDKTQVLVVGVFHFNYPGLDEYKTSEEDQVDVLKEPKRSEMTALVEYIQRFKPNKIAIEANPCWNATEKLREYKAGEHRDKRDERYQLAMRIAANMNLDTLYEVNAYSLRSELGKTDSLTLKKLTSGMS